MLLYNHKKEFLGMDEQDLKIFGFSDLSELQAQVSDFADFFIKEPGFVHNFKHVHWIDFVECAENPDTSKALIRVNAKSFRCNLNVKVLYLLDNPSEKAYMITLQNLRELLGKEDAFSSSPISKNTTITNNPPPLQETHKVSEVQKVLEEIIPKVVEIPAVQVAPKVVEVPKVVETLTPIIAKIPPIHEVPIPLETEKSIKLELPEIVMPQTAEVILPKKEEVIEIKVDVSKEPTPIVEKVVPIKLSEVLDVATETAQIIIPETPKVVAPKKVAEVVATNTTKEEVFVNNYIYDPQIASNELGLPIDLIEEFLEDFIVQAGEFKNGLYTAFEHGDMANIKALSHKLKGVAANLRIEDAHEVLTTINTTDSLGIVKSSLDTFYKIIAKLAGEEIAIQKPVETPIKPIEAPLIETPTIAPIKVKEKKDDDELVLSFKDEVAIQVQEPKTIKVDEDDLILSFKDDEIKTSEINVEAQEKIQPLEVIEVLEIKPELKEDTPSETDENVVQMESTSSNIYINIEEENSDVISISYSKQTAAAEIGIDDESFNELFDDYITESKMISHSMHHAIESNNLSMCKVSAYKLKSMSENMRIYDLTLELNILIGADSIEIAKKAVEQIDKIILEISKIES